MSEGKDRERFGLFGFGLFYIDFHRRQVRCLAVPCADLTCRQFLCHFSSKNLGIIFLPVIKQKGSKIKGWIVSGAGDPYPISQQSIQSPAKNYIFQ